MQIDYQQNRLMFQSVLYEFSKCHFGVTSAHQQNPVSTIFDIRFKLLSLHNLKLLFVMLEKLIKYVLPCEIVDYFELVS
ncbi:MAG: hypothetical protein LBS69_03520, partial [Prevotellaceae bacterium]|nr:hypothetical protein [Prevotellaceae bacterium]